MILTSSKSLLLLLAGFGGSVRATGIPLLGGRIKTTTDVQGILNLAYDARDMRNTTNNAEQKAIYDQVRIQSIYI